MIGKMLSHVRPSRKALGVALAILAPALLADTCPDVERVAITLNAIRGAQKDLLLVPPSGFTIDVKYPAPDYVVPNTLAISIGPLPGDAGETIDLLPHIVWSNATGAVAMLPPTQPLAVGSHRVTASVDGSLGTPTTVFDFAVRAHATGAPLATPNWIQFDFDLDRNGDEIADFDTDLEAFGLSATVRDWAIGEIVAGAQAFYDAPNPSNLPGGDGSDVTFSDAPAPVGPFTRICVGGEDPTGGATIGNVIQDPGNANPADVACDDFFPSGVFPREILFYSGETTFWEAFGPVLAEPLGTNPLDDIVLSTSYDPGDPAQFARFGAIETAVLAFAQAVATVAAHESGHALGLVPKGVPGRGLFGGEDGHNGVPGGDPPADNLLMNAGATFSFAQLSGASETPQLSELSHAYLRGRLVLDARVDGIYPAPGVVAVDPTWASRSGPPFITLTVSGGNFRATPGLRLLGSVSVYSLFSPQFVSANELNGSMIVPFLANGSYDLEVTNPDGQVRVLEHALSIQP